MRNLEQVNGLADLRNLVVIGLWLSCLSFGLTSVSASQRTWIKPALCPDPPPLASQSGPCYGLWEQLPATLQRIENGKIALHGRCGDAPNDADTMSASLPSMLQSYTSCVNHPPILLGTSSFTATGWEGSFYPKGMRSSDYLAFYAERFHTVEVDSTFYACPAARTVRN